MAGDFPGGRKLARIVAKRFLASAKPRAPLKATETRPTPENGTVAILEMVANDIFTFGENMATLFDPPLREFTPEELAILDRPAPKSRRGKLRKVKDVTVTDAETLYRCPHCHKTASRDDCDSMGGEEDGTESLFCFECGSEFLV